MERQWELQLMPLLDSGGTKQDDDIIPAEVISDLNLQSTENDKAEQYFSTEGLQLCIGRYEAESHPGDAKEKQIAESESEEDGAELVKRHAREEARLAAYAQHAKELAKRQMEMAEAEFASAKRVREEAQAELNRARLLKEEATRRINETCMEITCQACRRQFRRQLQFQPTTEVETCNLSLQLMPDSQFSTTSEITPQHK